jgi:hypothetical protein
MPKVSSHTSSRFRALVLSATVLLGVASGACTDEAPSDVVETVDRESFIDVYVDLRHVALRKTSRTVNAVERDSVLALHEVAEADLRLFLEVHHTEAEYMRDLWNEVEARMSLMLEMAGEGAERDG